MDRRNFLVAATGIAFSIGASGCLTDGGRNGGETDPSGVDSRFSGEECPSFSDTRETRCYHEQGEQPDVYLTPEQEVGDPTEESMEITLQNNSDSPVWGCPLSECWELHKLIEADWHSLTPFREVPLVSEPLEAGNSHAWNVEMSNEVIGQRSLLAPDVSELTYTGPGTYAFSVTFSTGEGGQNEAELVALFEAEGDTLEIEPTGVEGYESNDGTVHVHTEEEQSGEGD